METSENPLYRGQLKQQRNKMAVNASYVNDFPAIIKANIRHLKD
jgi:hypothetical protein